MFRKSKHTLYVQKIKTHTLCSENQNTHFMFRKSKHTLYVQKCFSENRVFYKMMWKNMVKLDRPQMTIE